MRIPILLAVASSLCSAGVPDVERQVDEIFAAVAGGKLPGAAVAVTVDGRTVLRKGYGMADVAGAKAISPGTIFRIASVTKSLTATAILQLVDAGKLKLDDPISRYLPDAPGGGKILVRHLLSHTAGVPDFIPYAAAMRGPLEFEPGSRLNYTNNGYRMLGRIIEKVSGRPWDEYLRDLILAPLGMEHTGFDRGGVAGVATGYLVGKAGAYESVAVTDARDADSAGGLCSTVDDLVRFENALVSGKLLRPETRERAWTPVALSDGRKGAYGYGWMLTRYRGLREIGHGGDITGFNSYIAYYPEARLTVTVLSNVGMRPAGPLATAGDLAHRVADLYAGDRMEKPGATVPVQVALDVLDAYVGRYQVDGPEAVTSQLGTHIVVTREGERLMAEAGGMKAPLDAKSATEFQAAGSPVELIFVRAGSAKCPKIVISLMGLREFQALRVE